MTAQKAHHNRRRAESIDDGEQDRGRYRLTPARSRHANLPLVQRFIRLVDEGVDLETIAADHGMTVHEVEQFLSTGGRFVRATGGEET